MLAIKSSTDSADDAVSQLTGVSMSGVHNKQSNPSFSNIVALTKGSRSCNSLIGNISTVCDVVLKQSNVVPQLAQTIEQQDSGAASGFGAR
jgi:hypothetical protein